MTSSYLLVEDNDSNRLRDLIKGCVATEYTPVSEFSQESSLAVLIQHSDSFEWMDISLMMTPARH